MNYRVLRRFKLTLKSGHFGAIQGFITKTKKLVN